MRVTSTRGLTLVELIVVAALVAIVSVVVVIAFSNFGNYFALRTAVQDVHSALLDAKQSTLASKNNTVHGVHIGTTSVTRFIGATYSATSTSNIDYPFSGGVTATSSLTSGTSNVVFTRLTGAAQSSGTISLTEPRGGETRTITVELSGLIEL